MNISIVIEPTLNKATRFGGYGTIGEALHIAASLQRHALTGINIYVEEQLSLVEQTLHGLPEHTRRYEVINNS